MRISISTKVFLGFAVVIGTFGVSSLYGLFRIATLRENIVFIRAGVLPVNDNLRDLNQNLRGFTEALDRRRQTDLEWQRTYLPNLRVYERIERLRASIARMASELALAEPDREYLRELSERVSALRTGTDLYNGLRGEDTHRRILGIVLPRSDVEVTNEQLYDAYAKSFVQLVNEGRFDVAVAVQSGLRTIFRQLKRDVSGLQRELERAVDAIHARAEGDEERAMLNVLVVSSMALIVSLLVMVLTQLAIGRLRGLIEGVRTISRGDYSQQVRVRGKDEVGQLAQEFNKMAESLQDRDRMLEAQREELIRAERLATIGKMSAQITHELRNPLSSIGLNAELVEEDLRSGADPAEAIALLRAIGREVDRLTDVTEQYLRFARLPKPDLESENLVDVIKGLLSFMAEELSGRGVRVVEELAPVPAVHIDENQIRQALMNIIRNAIEAITDGRRDAEGEVSGTIRVSTDHSPGSVRVMVSDSGPGVPEDMLVKIFDPFYSSKENGTGLGLALVHQIVTEHGGTVECASRVGQGTTFTLTLPLRWEEGESHGG